MTPAEEWSLSKRKWWETEKCEGSSQSTRCLCQTKKIRALKFENNFCSDGCRRVLKCDLTFLRPQNRQ